MKVELRMHYSRKAEHKHLKCKRRGREHDCLVEGCELLRRLCNPLLVFSSMEKTTKHRWSQVLSRLSRPLAADASRRLKVGRDGGGNSKQRIMTSGKGRHNRGHPGGRHETVVHAEELG